MVELLMVPKTNCGGCDCVEAGIHNKKLFSRRFRMSKEVEVDVGVVVSSDDEW